MYRDRKYLNWLRQQPCVITWKQTTENETVDPAHIGTAGRGVKSHDFEALPLIHSLHSSQAQGEMRMWKDGLNNPQALKEALQAWGLSYYLRYKLGVDTNLGIVEKINEMINEAKDK